MMLFAKIIPAILLVLFLSPAVWAQNDKPKEGPLSFGITRQLVSAQLSETRYLNIYLPPGYSENHTAIYPVIYLLDGGTDEDFFHIAGLIQFSTFPWVGRLPDCILVGIVNVDRKRDFTFPTTIKSEKDKYPTTGGSEKFIAFLEKELKPWINDNYRTSGSDMIIGESLGGLLAAEILIRKPWLFNNYIIVSPSLWWDDGSLLKAKIALSSSVPGAGTGIYIATGKEGLAPGPGNHIMEKDAQILTTKLIRLHNNHLRIFTDYLPLENHATVMHQAVYNAFRELYEKGRMK